VFLDIYEQRFKETAENKSICDTEILRMMMIETEALWDAISCRLQNLATFGCLEVVIFFTIKQFE
jgi:hypothetical protein